MVIIMDSVSFSSYVHRKPDNNFAAFKFIAEEIWPIENIPVLLGICLNRMPVK